MTLCQIHVSLLLLTASLIQIVASSRILIQQQDVPNPQLLASETIKAKNKTENVAQTTIGVAASAGYLFAEPTDNQLNQSDSIDLTLVNILNRNGPDMRPLRDFKDSDDITLEVAKRAWQLMHHHAQTAVSDKIKLIEPFVEQVLKDANVDEKCMNAAIQTMEGAKRFDSWAIQLLSSWGSFPPTGFYEGTFGDIGSFHGCVNVPENHVIGHAHYCTIAYRPVMPSRKNYELIIRKEPNELLHLFDRNITKLYKSDEIGDKNQNDTTSKQYHNALDEDAFTEVLNHAQYNHFIYYKFGICLPIQCSPFDVKKLAKLLGKQSILMSGPVKCHSKYEDDYESQPSSNGTITALQISTRDLNDGVYIWKPHMTRTQIVSLLLISFVTLIIIFFTLVDIILNKLPELYKQFKENQYKAALAKQEKLSLGKVHNVRASLDRSFCNKSMTTTSFQTVDSTNDTNNNLSLRKPANLLSASHYDGFMNEIENQSRTDTFKTIPLDDDYDNDDSYRDRAEIKQTEEDVASANITKQQQRSLFMDIVDDYSIITNVKQFFRVSQSQLKNDILCINGIRCITMSWIIITHTMQYNDWSAFARTREIETHLKSLINQPLFNASYLVDTFFLISGLLTSFSSFKNNNDSNEINGRGTSDILAKFSTPTYLIGRYLRLTPQIMFVSVLFILLPQLSRSGGPHWYTITGEYSENCARNWWINLFHIQAFYRSNEMCNFVCWWISVDMFYHLFALAIILLILYYGHKLALLSCSSIVLVYGITQAIKHYQLSLPPNLLSTIPQTGAMWSEMTLEFFWTPNAHAFPFFLGFYVGYLMAQRHSKLNAWFTFNRAICGWILATSLLLIQSYSTYFWVIGRWQYTRLISTIFYFICPLVWSTCLAWIIVACQYGYGSWINQMLSCKLFIILGKASYVVYLSHFLVLFTFFGSQNLLLEPTQLVMLYVIVGNICLSMLLGSVICVVYEMPWLKTQKRLMKHVRLWCFTNSNSNLNSKTQIRNQTHSHLPVQ